MFKLSFELSALCAGEDLHRERIQHHVRSGDRDRQLERSRHQACGNSTSANKHRLTATGPAFLDWNAYRLRAPTGAGAVAEAGSTRRPATIIGDERRLLEDVCGTRDCFAMKNVLLRLARHLTSRRSVGLSLLAVLICLRIWDPAPLEELRLRSFDLYQSISPRSSPVRPVVIVDIDEASIARARAMALAAHHPGGPAHPAQRIAGRGGRLRRDLPGARSLVAERGGEAFSRGRRCDPRAARAPAQQRRGLRQSHRAGARGGGAVRHPRGRRARVRELPADRLCHRRSRSRHAI